MCCCILLQLQTPIISHLSHAFATIAGYLVLRLELGKVLTGVKLVVELYLPLAMYGGMDKILVGIGKLGKLCILMFKFPVHIICSSNFKLICVPLLHLRIICTYQTVIVQGSEMAHLIQTDLLIVAFPTKYQYQVASPTL